MPAPIANNYTRTRIKSLRKSSSLKHHVVVLGAVNHNTSCQMAVSETSTFTISHLLRVRHGPIQIMKKLALLLKIKVLLKRSLCRINKCLARTTCSESWVDHPSQGVASTSRRQNWPVRRHLKKVRSSQRMARLSGTRSFNSLHTLLRGPWLRQALPTRSSSTHRQAHSTPDRPWPSSR